MDGELIKIAELIKQTKQRINASDGYAAINEKSLSNKDKKKQRVFLSQKYDRLQSLVVRQNALLRKKLDYELSEKVSLQAYNDTFSESYQQSDVNSIENDIVKFSTQILRCHLSVCLCVDKDCVKCGECIERYKSNPIHYR